ncbi:MAG: SDR family oxidoreductase [Candidatus ainarchaeum sp.]|nr:SDR family oxidoreductase [Candidatus ainarchaeum sp.]
MKVLVLGGSGMLGSRFVESRLAAGDSVVYTYNKNSIALKGAKGVPLNAEDYDSIIRLVEAEKPGLVIDTIAHPSVDFCDKDPISAYKINSASCEAAAIAARKIGAKLVYISTAFVFGIREGLLTEEDTPNPICAYGYLKLLGEEAAKIAPDHVILRTDQVFGWTRPGQKKTFVVTNLEKMERGEEAEVCEDWFNCPTYVEDLVPAANALAGSGKTGIYHAVGSSFLNRVEWCKMIAREFGEDESLVTPINSAKLNLPAKRSKCNLSNQKIIRDSGVKMRTVGEALKDMKKTRN